MARPWQPSKRSKELIAVLWNAFEAGDRWVKFQSPHTARYTGVSLYENGIGEFDTLLPDRNYSMRMRLDTHYLELNGYVDRDHATYRVEMDEARAEEPGQFLNPYLIDVVEVTA